MCKFIDQRIDQRLARDRCLTASTDEFWVCLKNMERSSSDIQNLYDFMPLRIAEHTKAPSAIPDTFGHLMYFFRLENVIYFLY